MTAEDDPTTRGTDDPRSTDDMRTATTTTDPEAETAGSDAAPEGVDAGVTGVVVTDDEPTDGVVPDDARAARRGRVPRPAGDDRGGDRGGERSGGSGGVNLLLAALAIAGLAGTLFFGFQWNQERAADAAQASMETTASDFLVALFDFDGRTIDADFDNILDYATGEFADEAEAQFADDDTRAALREVQASSRVEVRDLFVQSFDGDRGRVFAVVDQTIANNQFPNPRSDQVRLEIGLRKVDGEWKVATLDVLEAPAAAAAVAGGTVPTGG